MISYPPPAAETYHATSVTSETDKAYETAVLALVLSYVIRLDIKTRTVVDHFAGDTGSLRGVIARTRVCAYIIDELEGLGLHTTTPKVYEIIERHWNLIELYGTADKVRDDVFVPVFSYEAMILGVDA